MTDQNRVPIHQHPSSQLDCCKPLIIAGYYHVISDHPAIRTVRQLYSLIVRTDFVASRSGPKVL